MVKQEYDRHARFYELLLKLGITWLNKAILKRIYDRDFFLQGERLKCTSAHKVAEIITNNIRFDTVFDIGCGMGIYLDALHKLGKHALGCDFSFDGVNMAPQNFTVFLADATKPIVLNRKFDLLICFEVAEHIPSKFSRQLVENCTNNSDKVLFTAAPIGQGGVGHINEQPYSFWIDLFARQGFDLDQELSESMREQMKTENVVFWIANNIMLFRKRR